MTGKRSSARGGAGRPLALFAFQAAVLLGLIVAFPHPLALDAPRLLSIERVRRSLEREGGASPFAKGYELAPVPYARPFHLWMGLAEPWLGERGAFKACMGGASLLLACGLAWLALAMRLSRRWGLALAVPLVFHWPHYMGLMDYCLGLAMVPWGLGAALRLQKPGPVGKSLAWIVLGASALFAGLCSPLAAIPFGAAVGALALARFRSWKLFFGLGFGASLAPAASAGLMLLGSGSGPAPAPPVWSSAKRLFSHFFQSLHPSDGPLKLLFWLAFALLIAGLMNVTNTIQRWKTNSGKASRKWSRSLGGPVSRRLFLASGGLIALLYVALPWRIGHVSHIDTRIFAAFWFCAAFALPARHGPSKPLLAIGVTLLLAATIGVHALANRDQAALASAGRYLKPGEWAICLEPYRRFRRPFPYLARYFHFAVPVSMDAITGAEAVTPSLYVPPGTFPIRLGSTEGADYDIWDQEAIFWTPEWVAKTGRKRFSSLLFAGMSESEVRGLLAEGGFDFKEGQWIAGPNWALWLR